MKYVAKVKDQYPEETAKQLEAITLFEKLARIAKPGKDVELEVMSYEGKDGSTGFDCVIVHTSADEYEEPQRIGIGADSPSGIVYDLCKHFKF